MSQISEIQEYYKSLTQISEEDYKKAKAMLSQEEFEKFYFHQERYYTGKNKYYKADYPKEYELNLLLLNDMILRQESIDKKIKYCIISAIIIIAFFMIRFLVFVALLD